MDACVENVASGMSDPTPAAQGEFGSPADSAHEKESGKWPFTESAQSEQVASGEFQKEQDGDVAHRFAQDEPFEAQGKQKSDHAGAEEMLADLKIGHYTTQERPFSHPHKAFDGPSNSTEAGVKPLLQETVADRLRRRSLQEEAPEAAMPEKHSWFPTSWLGLGKARTAIRPGFPRSSGQAGQALRSSGQAEKTPHIVHVDVDAFFASVEQVLNPKLRGKPVLVGRGVVASASYEAKFRGVKTAMSFRDALRICPKAIVVPGQYEHYADFAERVRRILETYTPAVETAALDDFYLDFAGTERLYPDFEATLRRLQAEILGRTGLGVSMGAARTKVVASIASRLERPRGFRIVEPGKEESFLAPLPVEKLHGIGHTHAGALSERGITTIGQLRQIPKPVLMAAFGEAIGQQIWERARGLDGREVLLPSTPKSISRETTIEGGSIDTEFLGGLLEYLSERIGKTLREYGNQARTIGLRVRYVDHFSEHQTLRLARATNDERELLVAAKDLFAKLFTRRVAIRLVGISVTNLDADRQQNELFDTDANRRWYLNREVDRVRGRYGWNAVFYGKGLELREHYATKKNGLMLSTPCLSR